MSSISRGHCEDIEANSSGLVSFLKVFARKLSVRCLQGVNNQLQMFVWVSLCASVNVSCTHVVHNFNMSNATVTPHDMIDLHLQLLV